MGVVEVVALLVLAVGLSIAVSLGWGGALVLLVFMVVGLVTEGGVGC